MLAGDVGNAALRRKSLTFQGIILSTTNNPGDALLSLAEALRLAEDLGDPVGIASVWNSLGSGVLRSSSLCRRPAVLREGAFNRGGTRQSAIHRCRFLGQCCNVLLARERAPRGNRTNRQSNRDSCRRRRSPAHLLARVFLRKAPLLGCCSRRGVSEKQVGARPAREGFCCHSEIGQSRYFCVMLGGA